MSDERLLSVQDVHNAFAEHKAALDKLWPETDRYGPRKVHIVELLDAIRLRLFQRAEKNSTQHKSAFELAAEKIKGPAPAPRQEPLAATTAPPVNPMQTAYEDAKARIARNTRPTT